MTPNHETTLVQHQWCATLSSRDEHSRSRHRHSHSHCPRTHMPCDEGTQSPLITTTPCALPMHRQRSSQPAWRHCFTPRRVAAAARLDVLLPGSPAPPQPHQSTALNTDMHVHSYEPARLTALQPNPIPCASHRLTRTPPTCQHQCHIVAPSRRPTLPMPWHHTAFQQAAWQPHVHSSQVT
jgi:hypothetical protein